MREKFRLQISKPHILAAVVLLFAIVIVGVLGNYAYVDSERAVEQTYKVSYGSALENSSRVLDMNLRTVIEAARSFLNEPDLRNVLESANYSLPENFSMEDRRRLADVAETLATQNAAVNSILFMDLQGTYYMLNNVNQGTYEFDQYYQTHSILEEPWVKASREAKGREVFLGTNIFGVPQGRVFFLTKYLINPSTGRPMGYLAIALNRSMIARSIVNNSDSYASSMSFVAEGENSIIFSQGTEEQQKALEQSVKNHTDEEIYLFISVPNETTGWRLFNAVERKEIGAKSRSLRVKVWLGGGVVLLLILVFGYMYLTNQRLAEHLLATQLNERESELQLLQSQINPHFLYNTLDSLYFMAIIHGDDEIADMTMALSEHFKLTLNNGSKYITVENSLQWIRGYLKIMNMRFNNRFTLVEEVDPELLDKEILTFLLQPCVENAMYHGLEPKLGEGTITIRVHRGEKASDLCIEVEDDGVGMEDLSTWESGYGIRNVKERLQLHYGADYGIQVESTLKKGTKVSITVPIA